TRSPSRSRHCSCRVFGTTVPLTSTATRLPARSSTAIKPAIVSDSASSRPSPLSCIFILTVYHRVQALELVKWRVFREFQAHAGKFFADFLAGLARGGRNAG